MNNACTFMPFLVQAQCSVNNKIQNFCKLMHLLGKNTFTYVFNSGLFAKICLINWNCFKNLHKL